MCVCVWGGRGRGGRIHFKEKKTFFHLALAGRSPDSSSSGNPSGLEGSREPTLLHQLLPWIELSQLEGVLGGD